MNKLQGFPKPIKKKKITLKKAKKRLTLKIAKLRAWSAFALWYRYEVCMARAGAALCYTCDNIVPYESIQPGHWMTGHTNTNYINIEYIRPQCKYCNLILKGNQGIFWERIEAEIGTEKFMYLREHSKDLKEISIQDYLDLEEKCKEMLRSLQS